MKTMKNSKGFTLVEIMIVVAIIGLLAAIAVPNFMQARQTARTNACINNLRLISGAQDQWALETGATDSAAVTLANVGPYMKGGVAPTCPIGSTAYVLTTVNADPTCAKFDASTHNAVI